MNKYETTIKELKEDIKDLEKAFVELINKLKNIKI